MRHSMRESSQPMMADPPLSRLHREVASLGIQDFRQCSGLVKVGQPIRPQTTDSGVLSTGSNSATGICLKPIIGDRGVVTHNAVLPRIKPCQDRCQGRAAEAAWNITSTKDQRIGSELIDGRRFDHGMAHEPKVVPCLVVADDQDDVGW